MSSISSLRALFLSAFALSAFAIPDAHAVTTYAKFYAGGAGYTGPYSGAGTVYDATKALATDCPTAGGCGPADNVSNPQVFAGKGITATAGPAGNSVWNDFSPNFAGLGVGTGDPSDTDQIAGTDVLTLAFSSSVRLLGVGTLFDAAHTPFGASFPTAPSGGALSTIAFLLSVDGGAFTSINYLAANSALLSLVGSTFAFMSKEGNPDYYVSALAYETCGPAGAGCGPGETPIPGAVFLMGSVLACGVGGMQLMRRRRKLAA